VLKLQEISLCLRQFLDEACDEVYADSRFISTVQFVALPEARRLRSHEKFKHSQLKFVLHPSELRNWDHKRPDEVRHTLAVSLFQSLLIQFQITSSLHPAILSTEFSRISFQNDYTSRILPKILLLSVVELEEVLFRFCYLIQLDCGAYFASLVIFS
jgi:hypothetical protein